ncbi:hypothetical protein [Zooshikella ganghwensis]|uniref:Uncharacterized protein n=1 Tax=Zooshikella ganghwensis TaxID=202772 RepID=A0A4P9VMA0_9GAMM|nr:hypothetical protein [Zooshikella ganghwensis]RDH44515.1 hypothetical protein B9G39_14320 [Zooshikella ganghwensis]
MKLNNNEFQQRFLTVMQKPGLIRQLYTQFISYKQDDAIISATVNHPIITLQGKQSAVKNNCYVVSPMTQLIYFTRDELPKVSSRILRIFCLGLTYLVEVPFRWAKLDQIQTLNNLCFSTNFYAKAWKTINLKALRKQALGQYPHHALMLRSLNEKEYPEIIAKVKEDGWLPIVNRQVYLFMDFKKWQQKRDARADLKLLKQPDWCFRVLDPDNQVLMKLAEDYYNQLYLDKYSKHNIQFTSNYFAQHVKAGLLELYGLFHKQKMLGVVGFCGIDDTLTVPIIGYNMQMPKKMALYRRLVAFNLSYAQQNNLKLNLSAGAPEFKRLRGAEAVIEYNFVYIQHLSRYQKTVWHFLSWLSQHLYKPLLERFEL